MFLEYVTVLVEPHPANTILNRWLTAIEPIDPLELKNPTTDWTHNALTISAETSIANTPELKRNSAREQDLMRVDLPGLFLVA